MSSSERPSTSRRRSRPRTNLEIELRLAAQRGIGSSRLPCLILSLKDASALDVSFARASSRAFVRLGLACEERSSVSWVFASSLSVLSRSQRSSRGGTSRAAVRLEIGPLGFLEGCGCTPRRPSLHVFVAGFRVRCPGFSAPLFAGSRDVAFLSRFAFFD